MPLFCFTRRNFVAKRIPPSFALFLFFPHLSRNSSLIYRARLQVHPRACGERARAIDPFETPIGSSPRVRGTLVNRRTIGRLDRFIPARAGNASKTSISLIRETVHPRACGERALTRTSRKSESGSSPRVRGTPLPCCVSSSRCAVHPRACGERRVLHQFPRHDAGSSPRVRGTHPRC